jgi:hypothetical protein
LIQAGVAMAAPLEGTDTHEPFITTRIILLIEATAAANASWHGTRKWLDTILHLMDKDNNQEQQEPAANPKSSSRQSKYQYALIVYATQDRSTPAPIQSSSWTSDLSQLFAWLDGVQFVGGITSKGMALTHALAEAIVLSKCPYPGGAKPAAAGNTDLLSCSTAHQLSEPSQGHAAHLALQAAGLCPPQLPAAQQLALHCMPLPGIHVCWCLSCP